MKPRAFLGLSHTPLMGLNPVDATVESALAAGLQSAREHVARFAPEQVVLMAPDHYNGFFNELMPPFCIGTQATSVGDYLTPAGDLSVAGDAALAMADHLMDAGFDVAVSRRMVVDHGFAQPLQLMFGGLGSVPVIPVFMNAVAPPGIPRLHRCRQLGDAIGSFLDRQGVRTLVIGSGGLSHEPPVPLFDTADAGMRERITLKQNPTPAERDAKTQRVMAAGMALAQGSPQIKPLNAAWDAAWMNHLEGDDDLLDQLCGWSESEISATAGRSAHESKTWLIARAALGGGRAPARIFRHYQAIPEYIAGFGILMLERNQ